MKHNLPKAAYPILAALCFYAAVGLLACIFLNLRNPGLLSFLNDPGRNTTTSGPREAGTPEPLTETDPPETASPDQAP